VTSAARAGALAALLAASVGCGPPTSGKTVEELWTEHCQKCHGADGSGNPAQRALDPGVDLTASKLVAARARGLVYQRIAYGYQAMPGYRHKLELGDLQMLTEFVLGLQEE
jgi:mono/diheme cytochrome c family protein